MEFWGRGGLGLPAQGLSGSSQGGGAASFLPGASHRPAALSGTWGLESPEHVSQEGHGLPAPGKAGAQTGAVQMTTGWRQTSPDQQRSPEIPKPRDWQSLSPWGQC